MTHTLIGTTIHLLDAEFVAEQFVAIVGRLDMGELAAYGSAALADNSTSWL